MSIFVKICGLTDTDNVSSAIDAGADAVGFVFAKSVREVSVDRAVKISQQVPKSVLRVAVMQHPTQAEWQMVADGFAPDVLQTDLADFAYLEIPDEIVGWPVMREGQATNENMPETFLYEGRKSGQGETVDWQAAAVIALGGKMILAGGLGQHNVADAIRQVRPFGVDVSSAVEASPGKKDARKIAAFIAAAKNTRYK